MSLKTTLLMLLSIVLLVSISSVSYAHRHNEPSARVVVISSTGAVFGGTPNKSSSDGNIRGGTAQIAIDQTINGYTLNETDNRNETSITNISFSHLFYLFPSDLLTVTDVNYNAQGGTCTRTGNERIDCTGDITAFFVSYNYTREVPADNGVLRYSTGFRAYGFRFDGEFNIYYPDNELEYISSEVEPTKVSGNGLTWRKNNTDRIFTTSFFNFKCVLTEYSGSRFVGKTIVAHIDFVSALNRINQYAEQADVQVHVTSSFRTSTNVPGAIVPPARRSNHLVGHAIDMNVKYGQNYSQFCNSGCLIGTNLPSPVNAFISSIRADSELRWGGDFSRRDPVHIDKGLNLLSPDSWQEEYQRAQSNPSCRLNKPTPASLSTNYQTGKSGSTFTAVGTNFPPNTNTSITVNQIEVGTVSTDVGGGFKFFLDTSSSSSSGHYDLRAVADTNTIRGSLTETSSAVQRIILDNDAPRHEPNPDVAGSTLNVSSSIQPLKLIHLPILMTTEEEDSEIGP